MAHALYTVKGERVPSVTKVIGDNWGGDKQPLIAWAYKQGRSGQDLYAARDKAGSIGTLTHLMIQQHLVPPSAGPFQINYDEWTGEQQAGARRGYEAFLDWLSHHEYTTVGNEISLVSERFRFGGTLDWVVGLDGLPSYVDFKTSKGLYATHRIQVSAYLWLWYENHGEWLKPHLLRLGKENGSFHHHPLQSLRNEWRVFRHLLEVNRLRQSIDP